MNTSDGKDTGQPGANKPMGPLRPYGNILQAEIQQAVVELKRPLLGLIMSGLIAGFGIGTSVLAMGILLTFGPDSLTEPGMRILLANAYAIGFVLVILGNTDLFTEYTTIALLPVMTGDAPASEAGRLWAVIYLANIVGGFLFAAILVSLGPALEIIDADALAALGLHAMEHPGWVLFLSSLLAGWLMGLMSWLVSSTRETISQIVFVWLVAAIIGLAQLHHAIIGAIEVFCAIFVAPSAAATDAFQFFLWVTLGNVVGGFIFAALIRYSVLIRGKKGRGRANSG